MISRSCCFGCFFCCRYNSFEGHPSFSRLRILISCCRSQRFSAADDDFDNFGCIDYQRSIGDSAPSNHCPAKLNEHENGHHDNSKWMKIASNDESKTDDKLAIPKIAKRLIWIGDYIDRQYFTGSHRNPAYVRSSANAIHRSTCDNQRMLKSAASAAAVLVPLAICTAMLTAAWLAR